MHKAITALRVDKRKGQVSDYKKKKKNRVRRDLLLNSQIQQGNKSDDYQSSFGWMVYDQLMCKSLIHPV